MSQFFSQFEEQDIVAAYARAAETLHDLQQSQPDLPLGSQQQQDQQEDQEQQSSSKVPPTALSFLQTVLQRAQERSSAADGVGDPLAYLNTGAGRGLLWAVLREQFTADEASLLDTAFGAGWQQTFGQQQQETAEQQPPQQLDAAQMMARLATLEPEDVGRLGGLMTKLNAMSRQMDTLSAQLPKRPPQQQQSSSTSSGSTAQPAPAPKATTRSKQWGASLLRHAASRAAVSADAATNTTSSSSGGGGVSGGLQQAYSWDLPLPSSAGPLQRLQRLLALSSQTMRQQQQQWGIPASQQFQVLMRLYQQLVQLEAAQATYDQLQQQQQQQQPPQQAGALSVAPLSPQQAAAVYESISAELSWLVRQVADTDTPTRSAFWYMNALLDDEAWTWDDAGEAAAAGSNGAPQQPSQQQRQRQSVAVKRLESLGVFLAAAASLEPLQEWAHACAGTRPEAAAIPELQQVVSALVDDDWFLKPDMRQQAMRGAQAAAAAAAGQPEDGASSSRAFGLQPHMIDTQRVLQLACLDTTQLWFLAEMEAAEDPAQVVAKWSLHPTVGPKLKGKDWLLSEQFGLQPPLLAVYSRLRSMDYMARV